MRDRVLTQEAVCVPEVSTRAELKAAWTRASAIGSASLPCPTGMSRADGHDYLFQDMTGFNVDISRWAVSQVTDARGMFQGASSFYRDLRDGRSRRAPRRRGCSRALTPGCPGCRAMIHSTRRTARPETGRWTRARRRARRARPVRAVPVGRAQSRWRRPGVGRHDVRFPDQNALKTAVDNCLRVNPTGVACCNHGGTAARRGQPRWLIGTCRW